MLPSDFARLHGVWRMMLSRCENPLVRSFADYGARGIKVCAEWHDFDTFALWAADNGYDPNLQLDRQNNDGNYEPSNCRWVTRQVNANNKRNNTKVKIWGETKTLAEWSRDERCVVSMRTLTHRVQRLGWDPVRSMETPSTRTATTCINGHERTVENVGFQQGRRFCKRCHAERQVAPPRDTNRSRTR